MSDAADIKSYLEARSELANQLIGQAQAGLEDAKRRAWDLTGVPDIAAGANALARGDTLAGIGQAGAGALQLGSMVVPVARLAAGMPLRAALGGALADEAGTLRVWHGTPHTFEPVEGNPFGEFKNEAIGSGEGVQAYGWGHYVAGAQGVAKRYQEGAPFPTLEGVDFFRKHELAGDYTPWNAMRVISQYNGNVTDAINFLDRRANTQEMGSLPSDYKAAKDSSMWLAENKDKIGWDPGGGNLLEVHVLPDEHELLDWDRPASQWPDDILEKIQDLAAAKGMKIGDVTGERFYKELAHQSGGTRQMPGYTIPYSDDEAASRALHEAGIPGIKYLDAGSRQVPAQVEKLQDELKALQDNHEAILSRPARGVPPSPDYYIKQSRDAVANKQAELEAAQAKMTHNYVIFDPSNLRIIGRNGQRLEPIDHDPFSEPKP